MSRGAKIKPGLKQQKERSWCDHCQKPGHKENTCRNIHGKSNDWKPRQNMRNHSYQASTDSTKTKIDPTSSSAFSYEQLDELYKMFSSFQTSSPLSSLAHKGYILKALSTTTQPKASWIIDSGASDHKTNSQLFFSTYSPCADNLKVKIVHGSLSPVA